MKTLKRSVMSILVLSLFLSVVPVFVAFGDDVDQNITTEVKQISANQVYQSGSAKKEEKSHSTVKTEESEVVRSQEIREASKPLNICKNQILCSIIISFLLVFYLVALLFGRMFWVVIPNNEYLKAHVNLIQVRLDVENDLQDSDPKKEKIKSIKEYLAEIKKNLEMSIWTCLIAFTGKQMSAWRSLHEAERLAIDFYSPKVVKDQAIVILDKLHSTWSGTTTLEDQLKKRLDLDDNKNNLKELLKEARTILHRDEDAQFELLADAQNKALWLMLAAVLILLGLFWIFPEAQILFLAGATGGLLMRLRRVVKTRALPFDYGVSWTVLYLAPLVGALTGWAGTLLFVLLQSWGIVGVKFAVISIIEPTYATLMVAIVFGFSAVLFDKFIEDLEKSISKK